MLRNKTVIVNKLGLHARAAAKLVHLASSYTSTVELIKDHQTINAKSIMGVMMLGASKGTELELAVTGADEQSAMASLIALIDNRFGEAD